ncbi:MAG: IclR family transcriptional regulator [Peptococcaceae bacterium]|nr:IclR family transcriptional regulator [Peptococcaceae bacterium]
MKEIRDKQIVNSVLKAFNLLEIISREKQIGISELARKSSLSKTTTARLLATLKRAGVVNQRPENQHFFLTTKLFELGSRGLDVVGLRSQAQPLIEDFIKEENKTVMLSVLSDLNVTIIGKFEAAQEIFRVITSVGDRAPIHCSANGLAITAFLDPERRAHVINNNVYTKYTPKTITDPESMERKLAETRERGYALEFEERHPGICAVAAPVFDSYDNVVAAVSVPRMVATISEAELAELGRKLVGLAERISRRIGWRG